MRLRYILFVGFILCSGFLYAQLKEAQLEIEILFGDENLELGRNYYVDELADSVEFESIKFYISNLEIQSNSTWQEIGKLKHKLVDLEDSTSLSMKVRGYSSIQKLRFNLGIDSITNVSGAFGGDLDPTKGMYWSWQSGYINTKIEGKSKVFKTRNNYFQYHLGGYSGVFKSCQKVTLLSNKQEKLVLQLDIKEFFVNLNPTELSSVMSPSLEAVRLSTLLSRMFKLKE
ncbi:MAG: hypothetical protein JKY48_09070 [Flavobacteriales bacterium]|nr:hypothetical protein [Flavobacteriales bacterium]